MCESDRTYIPVGASIPRMAQASLSTRALPVNKRLTFSLRSTTYVHPWTQKTRLAAGSLFLL